MASKGETTSSVPISPATSDSSNPSSIPSLTLSIDVQPEPLNVMYPGKSENPIDLDRDIDIANLARNQNISSPRRSSNRLYQRKVLSKKPHSTSTALDDKIEQERSDYDDSSDADFQAAGDTESEDISLDVESSTEKTLPFDSHFDNELLATFITERRATLKWKRKDIESDVSTVEVGVNKSAVKVGVDEPTVEVGVDESATEVGKGETRNEVGIDEPAVMVGVDEPAVDESEVEKTGQQCSEAPVEVETSPVPKADVPMDEDVKTTAEDDLSDNGIVFGQISKEAEKIHKGCLPYPSLIYLLLRHLGFVPARSDHVGPEPELFTVNKHLLFGDMVVDLPWGTAANAPNVAHSVGNISSNILNSVFTSSFLRSRVWKLNTQIKELTALRDVFQNLVSSQKGGEENQDQGDQGTDEGEDNEAEEDAAGLAAAAELADLRNVASTSRSMLGDKED